MSYATTIGSHPADTLRDDLSGDVFLPGDSGYEEASQAWNLAMYQRPAAVVLAESADDVVAAVRFARSRGMRIAPQGTGHGAMPLEPLDRAILVRTRRMRAVSIDAVGRIAHAEAGSIWRDVTIPAGQHGLAALAGTSPDVGVTGYTLGGGIGWLARRYGLAANSVVAAEVVTPDGRLVRADAGHETDLFWAVRGGGGSVGIVSSLDMSLYPVSHVYAGALFFPIERSSEILRAWREWTDIVPDEFTSIARILRLPATPHGQERLGGRALALVEAAYLGDADVGARLLQPMRDLGPDLDTFATIAAADLSQLHMDPDGPVPAQGDGALLDDFPAAAIGAMVARVGSGSDTSLASIEVRHLGGALARPIQGGGAQPAIDARYLMFAVGLAPTPEAADSVRADARILKDALGPWHARYDYYNFGDTPAEARAVLPLASYHRLQRIKASYDPDSAIISAHPVWPASGGTKDDSLEDTKLIPTHDQRLRVFVSSSMNELAEERRAVQRAISALRLTPVLFELGARPHPPRDVYRAYLEQSDIFIGLYWQQYGRVSPGLEISGLEDEFELSGRLPRLMYVKVPAPEREPRLADLLKRVGQEVSYRVFRTARELNRLVRDDLAALLSERFAASRAPSLASLPTLAAAAPRTVPPPLPVGTTSLIGREADIAELAQLVDRNQTRLVTLTGPGGVGKTRLAMAVGDHLRRHFAAGTVFVPLAPVTEPARVLTAIALAVGADLAGAGSPLEALIEHFGDGRWLLILDNLEQVATVAPDLDTMLERCRGLMILTTSRTVLGLRAEWEYSVPPLSFAADLNTTPLADLALLPAVALFLDRARAVHPGFSLTEDNAAAVAEICRRLEGLPLAIELAAARTRLLQPDALLKRLSASLDVLGTGGPDVPERQRTLRATVEWSIGLLDDAERSLLEISAVFVGGWSLPAAAHVAALTEERTLEVSEALARHSLIDFADSVGGPRGRMLQTIREFVSQRLEARSDATEVEQRHAEFYREMAEQTDRYLRSGRQDEWLERLAVESGNLAAAVRWYLDHDLAPLPHLFRAMWPLWFLRDIMGDGRSWLEQLLPCADSFDPEARAELMWTALVAALEVGDDEAALAARQQLEPLLPGIRDRFLQAAAQLAAAWSLPITGDNGAALHAASGSLEEFRRQDEPFWTALALGSIGNLEITAGHQDRALTHLREAVEVSDRFGSAFLSTFSRTLLSALLIEHGRLDEAGALLQDALNVSLTAGSTRSVTLSLSGFARLAIAEGDRQRAVLLAGAADGLRRRAGLQVWPMMRAAEAELVAQGRQTLEPGQFDEMFADGTHLSSQEAVDVIHDDFVESKAS